MHLKCDPGESSTTVEERWTGDEEYPTVPKDNWVCGNIATRKMSSLTLERKKCSTCRSPENNSHIDSKNVSTPPQRHRKKNRDVCWDSLGPWAGILFTCRSRSVSYHWISVLDCYHRKFTCQEQIDEIARKFRKEHCELIDSVKSSKRLRLHPTDSSTIHFFVELRSGVMQLLGRVRVEWGNEAIYLSFCYLLLVFTCIGFNHLTNSKTC